MGTREFTTFIKKRVLIFILPIIFSIAVIIYKCSTAPMFHPKFITEVLFYLAVILLVISFLCYLRITLKNNTTKKLLVVVDYQKDFVDGSLTVERARELEKVIVDKIEKYRQDNQDIMFTKDTHYTNYLTTREGRYIPIEHCIIDTEGHGLYGEVAKYEKHAKKVFNKTSFGSIDLAKYISRSDYEEVEFCGVVSNICVLSNIIMTQTYNEKVEIKVDLNATKGMDDEIDSTLKKYLEQLTVRVKE